MNATRARAAGRTPVPAAMAHLRGRIGAVATGAAWLFFLLCQLVSGDWLPPAVSLSQYGLGPWGFLFSLWMLSVAVGVMAFYLAGPGRTVTTSAIFAVCIAGLVITALVRTDSDGAQHSWHAHAHLVGSVLALAGLPLGVLTVTRLFGRPGSVIATVLVVTAGVSLVLLLLAAGGIDTAAGGGAAAAWAFWQSVAVVCEMALLTVWGWLERAARLQVTRASADRR